METLRYTYKLRPGAQALARLEDEWHLSRWVWNECVNQQRTGKNPTAKSLDKMLTAARAAAGWLGAGSSVVQQQTIRDYASALRVSFAVRGRGRPKPKSRKRDLPSMNYTRNGFRLRHQKEANPVLALAGGVSIPVVSSRPLPSEPTSVRVYRDAAGWWWASFVVRREPTPAPERTAAIGVDWGVDTTATTTDPAYDLHYEGFSRKEAQQMRTLQRTMTRRAPKPGQKPSRGYKETKRRAAQLHRAIRHRRTDHAMKWANRVVADHGSIAVENFRPGFLAKSTMARKAADAAVGAAKRKLLETAARAGRKVVLVPPAYTTMTCSECHAIAKQRLGLHERIFRCTHCGHIADRDRNAARVVLALAGFDQAGADAVRHSHLPPWQVRMPAEPGIPRL